jgi:uncharacterized protein (TIGR03435 family)
MRGTSAVAGLTILLFFEPHSSYGQAPEKPEFEVATVRASAPRIPGQRPVPATRTGGPGTADPGRVSYSNKALSDIIGDAFDVAWNEVSGPDWIAADSYDIVAKVPEGTTKEQAKQMLQNLLVDRFHLAFHMQTKVVQGYELTLAPGGSKMKAHSDAQPQNSPAEKGSFPSLAEGEHMARSMPPGHVYIRFADTSVSEFARFLGNSLSAATMVRVSPTMSRGAAPPVLDKTGLTGSYDFTFDYAGSVFVRRDDLPSVEGSMENSLTKELGLKMVEAKVPVNVLVIDRIERTPAEN